MAEVKKYWIKRHSYYNRCHSLSTVNVFRRLYSFISVAFSALFFHLPSMFLFHSIHIFFCFSHTLFSKCIKSKPMCLSRVHTKIIANSVCMRKNRSFNRLQSSISHPGAYFNVLAYNFPVSHTLSPSPSVNIFICAPCFSLFCWE